MTSHLKILLVESDAPVRESLGRVLATENCEVVTVATPAEALRVGADQAIDLVVYGLPRAEAEDGPGVAAFRTQNPARPVVVLAAGTDPVRGRGLAASLPKPVDVPLLLATVRGLTGGTPASADSRDQTRLSGWAQALSAGPDQRRDASANSSLQ